MQCADCSQGCNPVGATTGVDHNTQIVVSDSGLIQKSLQPLDGVGVSRGMERSLAWASHSRVNSD